MSGGLLTCLDLNRSGEDTCPSISANSSTGSLLVSSIMVTSIVFPGSEIGPEPSLILHGGCVEWFENGGKWRGAGLWNKKRIRDRQSTPPCCRCDFEHHQTTPLCQSVPRRCRFLILGCVTRCLLPTGSCDYVHSNRTYGIS